MSTRLQVLLSVIVIGAAASVVAYEMRSGAPEDAGGGMEGHNHAAMTGGSERKPVVLDAEGARRIGVTFAVVERRPLDLEVRAVGTVTYDETRLASVSPKIDGWVERLFVDFTGAPVAGGEPLVDVYSPALVTAQEELILAARLLGEAASERTRKNAEELLESARRRLAYWDIPAEEIRRIEEHGAPSKTLTLHAPVDGIVVEKNVVEGDRIMPGMVLYRIADLSRVWIEAEVFEKDLALVREGQAARATFEAFPGRVFRGRVTYVYPTVSVKARTGRVRLELPNPDLSLKPGMYGEIDLQTDPGPPTLVVPRSAVIETGERTLVFVQDDRGALLPREVVPGRRAGRVVEILEGLSEGERVVSSAAFLIDAESNLGTMTGDMEGMGEADPSDSMEAMDHSGHQE